MKLGIFIGVFLLAFILTAGKAIYEEGKKEGRREVNKKHE